jgi:hypothetical protein
MPQPVFQRWRRSVQQTCNGVVPELVRVNGCAALVEREPVALRREPGCHEILMFAWSVLG